MCILHCPKEFKLYCSELRCLQLQRAQQKQQCYYRAGMGVYCLLLVGFFPSYFLNYLIENLSDMEEKELTFRITYIERHVRRSVFQNFLDALSLGEKKASTFTGVLAPLSAVLRGGTLRNLYEPQ